VRQVRLVAPLPKLGAEALPTEWLSMLADEENHGTGTGGHYRLRQRLP